MKMKNSKSLASVLRKSTWSKFCVFILVTNFINLSANFYEGNISLSESVNMDDPIDTITELIFEWALDGDADVIPDNGTEQDDNSLEKMKLALLDIPGITFSPPGELKLDQKRIVQRNIIPGHFSSTSPPPDRC